MVAHITMGRIREVYHKDLKDTIKIQFELADVGLAAAPRMLSARVLPGGPRGYPRQGSRRGSLSSDSHLDLARSWSSERSACHHGVATRPQTVKSLCFSVIPGLVMLTCIVLEGFITE